MYGDSALGEPNLRMIELARSFGSAAKFPGSGGAVVGLCLDPAKMVSKISQIFDKHFSKKNPVLLLLTKIVTQPKFTERKLKFSLMFEIVL